MRFAFSPAKKATRLVRILYHDGSLGGAIGTGYSCGNAKHQHVDDQPPCRTQAFAQPGQMALGNGGVLVTDSSLRFAKKRRYAGLFLQHVDKTQRPGGRT
jgi:hypothetical protein